MECTIKLQNRKTGERTTLIAHSNEMAINMIEQSILNGWNVVIISGITNIINILTKKEEIERC